MFFLIYLLIISLLFCYARYSLGHLLGKKRRKYLHLVDAVIIGMIVFQISHRYFRNSLGINLMEDFSVLYYVLIGFMGSLIFFLLVKDIVRVLGKLNKRTRDTNVQRRDFLKSASLLGIGGGSAIISGLGFYESMSPDVKEVEESFTNLPRPFDGTTIMQISDLHISALIKREYVQNVVDKVNREQADFVAITGDLVDGRVSKLKHDAMPLKDLQAKYGVFYVTGNHEYYWGAEEWTDYLENELQIKVLHNEHVAFERDGQRLILAGVHDYIMGKRAGHQYKSDPFKAREGTSQKDFKLLLAHQPKSCFKAQEAGFDYMICGHTHGGQYLPVGLLVYLFQPYVKGLYNHKGMKLYVSTGSGYWGPPNRFGIKNEIAKHILRSA